MEHKGLLFKIIIVEHKGLPSKIATVEHKELGLIFYLLVFLNLRKLNFKCMTNLGKIMVMTWQLMWLNLSVATVEHKELGIIFHLLVFLNLRKLNFKLFDKFKKNNGNNMAVDVAYPKRSNINATLQVLVIYKLVVDLRDI